MTPKQHFIEHLADKSRKPLLLNTLASNSSLQDLRMRFSSSVSSQLPPLGTTIRNPYKFYTSLFCTLIHLFLRCRRLSKATAAFSAMRDYKFTPGLSAWNRLLNHFNCTGLIHQVFLMYQEMIFCGVAPNVVTKNIVIHSRCKVGDFDLALGLLRDNKDYKFMSDIVTYNTVIWGFCKCGYVEMGLGLVSEMVKRGVNCDNFTCNILMKGFCGKGMLGNAKSVMDMICSNVDGNGNICKDVVGFNTLMHGYCKSSKFRGALQLMGSMTKQGTLPDIVTHNTLINIFCEIGDFDSAKRIIDELLKCHGSKVDDGKKEGRLAAGMHLKANHITYTSLISGFGKKHRSKEALGIYREMVEKGIDPDAVTYSCIIKELLKRGRLADAKSLFDEMIRVGVDPNHVTYSLFVDFLFKSSNLMAAFNLQSQMIIRGIVFDVILFTTLIDGLFKAGRVREAEFMFYSVLESNVVPNCITFSALVDGRSKIGDMQSAESALQQMKEINVLPNVVTYSSLINGYVKSGMLEAAIDVLRYMICENVIPNAFIYSSLIDGCLKAGQKEIAEGLYKDMKM